MGKSSAPEAPNPVEVGKAQTGTNVSTAVAQQTLNNTNQVNPWGTTNFAQTGGYTDPTTGQFVPQFTSTSELTPLGQSILTGTEETGQALIPTAQNLAGQAATATTTPLNFDSTNNRIVQGGPNALNQDVGNAIYREQSSFLDPQWGTQEQQLHDQLSQQGIPVGSDAYNRAMTNFQSSRTQAYQAARDAATTGASDAASKMFGLALQGQGQNVSQQQLAQQNPLRLINMIFGGQGAPAAA